MQFMSITCNLFHLVLPVRVLHLFGIRISNRVARGWTHALVVRGPVSFGGVTCVLGPKKGPTLTVQPVLLCLQLLQSPLRGCCAQGSLGWCRKLSSGSRAMRIADSWLCCGFVLQSLGYSRLGTCPTEGLEGFARQEPAVLPARFGSVFPRPLLHASWYG